MEKPRPPKETAKPFFLKKGHRRFHSCTRRQQQCQGPPGGGHGSLSWQSVRQLKSSWAAGLDAIQLPPHPHPPSPAAEPCPSPAAPGPAYLLPLPSGPPPPPPSMPLPGPPLLSQTHCPYLQPAARATSPLPEAPSSGPARGLLRLRGRKRAPQDQRRAAPGVHLLPRSLGARGRNAKPESERTRNLPGRTGWLRSRRLLSEGLRVVMCLVRRRSRVRRGPVRARPCRRLPVRGRPCFQMVLRRDARASRRQGACQKCMFRAPSRPGFEPGASFLSAITHYVVLYPWIQPTVDRVAL